VRCVTTGRSVQVRWTDNGPGRKARRRGVVVDLSRAAMVALAGKDGIRNGLVAVEVKP
jgi:rare lipoprotein A (peptidoglycan hydrolase)